MEVQERLRSELFADDAADKIRRYLGYTGANFERYGQYAEDNEIHGDDIIAVTMLSMSVTRTEKRGITPLRILQLESQTDQIHDLLQWIPKDRDLSTISDVEFDFLFGPHGYVRELFRLLSTDIGFGNVAAHKLLARKRPRLIPIRDSRAEQVLGRPTSWWASWWEVMKVREIVSRTEELRHEADCHRFSLLRVADIVVWMSLETGANQPDDESEVAEG